MKRICFERMKKNSLTAIVALIAVGAFALDDESIVWIDGRDLPIEGRAFDDVEHYYDRLPSNVTEKVNEGVRRMKHHTSGMQFRFVTDSKRIEFHWLPYDLNALEMHHMPASSVSGIDIYRQRPDGVWRYVKTGTLKGRDLKSCAIGLKCVVDWVPGTPCLVNLPLYNGIRNFSIGIDSSAEVKPLPPRKSGVSNPVVFYGTSITQGGCASRPGLAFVNIVGRNLDVPVVGLGFSDSGRMEYEMSEYLARIDASCYVLDCLANMGGRRWVDDHYRERYEPFIRNLRANRPGVPIVMAAAPLVFRAMPTEQERFIRELYAKLLSEGWSDLFFLPSAMIFSGDEEGTVDGLHPNDRGMEELAKSYGEIIKLALKLK